MSRPGRSLAQSLAPAALALLLAASVCMAQVKLADTGYKDVARDGATFVERTITLDTGKKVFAIKTDGCALGMVQPTLLNWSGNEFVAATVNDEEFFKYNAPGALRAGFAERIKITPMVRRNTARVVIVQEGRTATVTIDLVAMAGDDKLQMSVRINPREVLESGRVTFNACPSALGPPEKLQRAVATQRRPFVLNPGAPAETLVLDTDEDWLFIYDQAFDLGASTGDGKAVGGCGMLFNPEEVGHVVVTVGPLSVAPVFVCREDTREMHFVLLDFANEKKNAEALKHLQSLREDDDGAPRPVAPIRPQ